MLIIRCIRILLKFYDRQFLYIIHRFKVCRGSLEADMRRGPEWQTFLGALTGLVAGACLGGVAGKIAGFGVEALSLAGAAIFSASGAIVFYKSITIRKQNIEMYCSN